MVGRKGREIELHVRGLKEMKYPNIKSWIQKEMEIARAHREIERARVMGIASQNPFPKVKEFFSKRTMPHRLEAELLSDGLIQDTKNFPSS
ncbi:MAG: hypothetical protein R2769_02795 [Saprospiraceae bacterium]